MRSIQHAPALISTPRGTLRPQCITLIQPTTIPNVKRTKLKKLVSPPLTLSGIVGKRWMEYQGMRNWDGLLDPLDDNLRAEILRYGHFVDAAYKSFEFDPDSPDYATCRFPKSTLFERCGLGGSGYTVTKILRATSGIQLPGWVEKGRSWVGTQSSYIGYVAVCNNEEEIKRLGRRDVVIAFRGTTTCLEWLENLRATLTHFPCNKKASLLSHSHDDCICGSMVESGFLSLYTCSISIPSLQDSIKQEIHRILQDYGGGEGEPLSLTITGHSLGAALAILAAYDIKTAFPQAPLVTVFSFGGPRVGNRSFRRRLEEQGTKVLRIVNSDDVITKLPGFVFDEVEEEEDDVASDGGFNVTRFTKWIQKRVEETQWLYSEVGEELRLSSRDSPYLRGLNIATCHDLNTYLHLVDGFVSSTCPFRSTATTFVPR